MAGQTCFVVMGYGVKKIPGTLVKLNLDDIYFKFIKPVLSRNHLKSVYSTQAYRGDEVPTSLAINKNFITSIFLADIVIADISTLNQNAIYELGLRHAMKPKSTIILCEELTISKYPCFDISMSPQLRYHRKKIVSDENYRRSLQNKLEDILISCLESNPDYIDSPVFDFNLYKIKPLVQLDKTIHVAGSSIRTMIKKAENLKENMLFKEAENQYLQILNLSFDEDILSQYLLCRYKKDLSLKNLLLTLSYVKEKIDLDTSTNENLLGIVAAINKQIFALTNERNYLEQARRYYKNGSNFESGNLYCARNYCALLLKQYCISKDIESIKEYYYSAVHFAKTYLTELQFLRREETDFDDTWYNENIKDMTLIAFGTDESIIEFTPVTKRQEETVTSGRKELKHDYHETLKIIKGK
ncbi:tetratricopeptide repeat-containing protein [Streptococcus mutans]|uniref:tetratricopeptide repeat-containing protein n=1 Tax=Streptococcus mutans TaxID=1309 RepID=UPI000464079D|nr:tetratricopeptide repeat-containing protein [Streptococcus mutans]